MTVTVYACPPTIMQFFDNAGNPAVGGTLLTQVGGNNYATYQDSAGAFPLPNPIPLNSRGEISNATGVSCQLFLAVGVTYTFTLYDALGNQLNQATYVAGLPQATFNQYLQTGLQTISPFDALTTAETSAGVTIVNPWYMPGVVDRYGSNLIPGSTDMTQAFQAAINQARLGGSDVTWGYSGLYLLATGALDCTFTGSAQQYGITFRQYRSPSVNLPPSTAGGILVSHSAETVFDLTGCNHFTFYDLSLVTATAAVPSACFLTARNSTGESNFPRFYNTTVSGSFTVGILYNYGSEDGMYVGNVWENYSTSAACNCVVITVNNYYKGVSNYFSSQFTTIYPSTPTPPSTTCHSFYGGDYSVNNATTTSDVFYIEGAVVSLRLRDIWMANSNPGTTHGRSYVYNDTTNGAATNCVIDGVKTEISNTNPTYGVIFSANTSNAIGWSFRDTYWNTETYTIYGGTGVTGIGFVIEGLQEHASNGIVWVSTLEDSTINWESVVTLGTSTRNLITGEIANVTITTNNDTTIIDLTSGSILAKGSLSMAGKGTYGQLTGWGTPTGGSVVNNFPGSGATLTQCGEALSEVLQQLINAGFLGP